MIRGPRVTLRAVEEHDLKNLQQWMNDPEISRLVGGFSFPVSLASQKRWFAGLNSGGTTHRFMVDDENGTTIGMTGLWGIDWVNRHALTAVKFSPHAQRKGYGTETVLTLCTYAFEQVGLNRLWSTILCFNEGSLKVYTEKCGWKIEGVNRQHVYRDGQFVDQYQIGVLKNEFLNLPQVLPFRAAPPQQFAERS